MEKITIVCVGKLKERFYQEAAAEYEKRLSRFCRLNVVEIPEQRLPPHPNPTQIERALAKEAALIRDKLPPGTDVIALCIEGQMFGSKAMAARISGRDTSFIIGGSYGLDASLKKEAAVQMSLSLMTFPHHLARIMLLEQVYRGFSMVNGMKYHK